jgi:hypothetical protein
MKFVSLFISACLASIAFAAEDPKECEGTKALNLVVECETTNNNNNMTQKWNLVSCDVLELLVFGVLVMLFVEKQEQKTNHDCPKGATTSRPSSMLDLQMLRFFVCLEVQFF